MSSVISSVEMFVSMLKMSSSVRVFVLSLLVFGRDTCLRVFRMMALSRSLLNLCEEKVSMCSSAVKVSMKPVLS